MAKDFRYIINSLGAWPDEIADMIKAAEKVSLREIRDNCNTAQIEEHLGYSRAFPMKNDPEASFFKSTYRGEACYFILHSSIEYVFVKP